MDIKTDLREARKKAGLTMTEAAKQSQAPYRTWQDWELGNRRTPKIALAWLRLYSAARQLLEHISNGTLETPSGEICVKRMKEIFGFNNNE